MRKDVIRNVVALVHAGRTKEAGLGRMAMSAAKGIGGAAKALVTRPKTGFNVAGREFAPGRALASTVGLGGGGAVAGGHINNAMKDRGMSPEQIFAKHKSTYGQQAQGLQQKIDQANSAGNFGPDGAEGLNTQLMADDFGGSDWSFGGLNPFVEQGAQHQKSKMQGAAEGLHREYGAKSQEYLTKRRGLEEQAKKYEEFLKRPNLAPEQLQGIQSSLKAVQQRLAEAPGGNGPEAEAIIKRMQAAGMPLPPGYQAQPAPAPAQPTPPSGPGQPAIPSTTATASNAGSWLRPDDFKVRPTY